MASRRAVKILALALALGSGWTSASPASGLSVGPDPTLPSASTTTDGDATGFSVAEDVAYHAAAGPWLAGLRNTGDGIASGDAVSLSQSLANTGTLTWTEWHQTIASTTVVGSGTTIPGFLFVADSLVVRRDGALLVEGVDYTLSVSVHTATTGGMGGATNFGHWEGISILFSPSGQIAPGQTLEIEQQLFEVFLDGDPWRPHEVAELRQHASVPEPATWGMLALGLALVLLPRR